MSCTIKKVILKKKSSGGWSASEYDISRFCTGVSINKAIGNQKDTASFKINKPEWIYASLPYFVEYNDLVKIYLKANSNVFAESDLLIEGVVRNVPMDLTSDERYITVKLNDFFEECFDIMVPASYTNKRWYEMIQDLMNKTAFTERGLYWASLANGWTGGDNPTVKYNGTDFPVKSFAVDYTPFYQIIEKLTGGEYTGDGSYFYYVGVEGGKRFLIIKTRQGNIPISTLTEGTETRKITVEKTKDNVKNFIIFFCGKDFYGHVIRSFYADYDSISEMGYKFYYMTEETANISDNVSYLEARKDELLGSVGAFNMTGGAWTSTSHFPTNYVPNYTWKAFTDSIGGAITSTTNSEYNDDLREICKPIGRGVAKLVADGSKTPAFEVKITYPFTNTLQIGGLYQVIIRTRDLDKLLRISDIDYSINQEIVTLKEDEARATL